MNENLFIQLESILKSVSYIKLLFIFFVVGGIFSVGFVLIKDLLNIFNFWDSIKEALNKPLLLLFWTWFWSRNERFWASFFYLVCFAVGSHQKEIGIKQLCYWF